MLRSGREGLTIPNCWGLTGNVDTKLESAACSSLALREIKAEGLHWGAGPYCFSFHTLTSS